MPKDSEYNEDCAIAFSGALVSLFKDKMRHHNKENSSCKVSLTELKDVFINTAASYNYAGYTRTHWALARVNTYLGVKKGEQPKVVTNYEQTSLGGFVFEAKVIQKGEYDISSNWIPSTKDFSLAKLEIEENKLNYKFSDISELYLEDYKPLKINNY